MRKYRLPHIVGKLRLSSFKWYQYWAQKVTLQNESEILLLMYEYVCHQKSKLGTFGECSLVRLVTFCRKSIVYLKHFSVGNRLSIELTFLQEIDCL